MSKRTQASARAVVAMAAVGAASLAAACGASTSDFDGSKGGSGDGGAAATGPGTGGSSDGSSGTSTGTGDDGSGGTGSTGVFAGDPNDGSADGACASTVVPTKVEPALLVFMFDRSGSMNDSVGGGLTKWTAVTPALESFFADPKSAGLSASLQFFTQTDECNVAAYMTPEVPMTPLPSGALFKTAIDGTMPNGDTPTLPALTGALQYATAQATANPGAHVAVVLVTDGEPHDSCTPESSIDNVVAEAQTFASTVPTYVIGVGKDLTRLNMVAAAGGTTQAFLVATTNSPDAGGTADETESDFVDALSSIRSSQATCDLAIPAAPTGQSLDFNKVNVVFSSSSGSQPFKYNAGCGADGGAGDGWSYDDPAHPTQIVLCGDTCAAVQGNATGELSVELGCATIVQ